MSDKRILIVEDDGIIAAGIQSILTKLKYDILDVVPSGEEALQKVGETPADLALMDIYLAGDINGIETAAQMRAQFNIPVIYLTAHANDELLQQAKITEPYGYIVKPVTERELHATIEMALYRHELEIKQKQTEEALRESEEKYKSFYENSLVGLFRTSIKEKKALAANDVGVRLFGYSSQEEYLRDFSPPGHYVDPSDRDKLLEELRLKGEVHNYIIRFIRKDGTDFWAEFWAKIYPDKGELEGVVIDITKRRQAEEALQESEEMYRTLVETSPDAVTVTDLEGHITYASPRTVELTGYERVEELLGRSVFELIAEEECEEAKMNLCKMLKEGVVRNAEYTLLRKDGTRFTGELSVALIKDVHENPKAFFAIVRDVTERKKVEEELQENYRLLEETLAELRATQHQVIQQERLRALGQMASGVAHDFNNTLTPILGYTELLFSVPATLDDKKKAMGYFAVMNTAAKDALNVISRLREFYRQRKKDEMFSLVNLNQLVKQTIELTEAKWKDQAQSDGITISVQTNLQQVPQINGNSSELRNALTNLIFNAVDAMPGDGTITICTHHDDEHVILEVSDTGIGMMDEVQQRCFEPFFSTKDERGSGLGLSIVHGIIRRHEGTIEIDSEPGKGTTVIIRLPIQMAEQTEGEEQKTATTTRLLHVLLVEDKLEVRDVITQYLLVDGHTVETANNGREGLEKFCKDRFDLVITDWAMPDMNGVQLATLIKEIAPNKPIIMLTVFGDTIKLTGDIPDAIDYLLSKPVTLDDFREALAKVIPRSV